MDVNYSKNQITLYGKVLRLDTLIKKLSTLSGEQIYHFLVDRSTQMPRKMNCMAMTSVLNNKIKFLTSQSLSKDAFSKLQYYSSYSEQQLFMLFQKICGPEEFEAYRMNLFGLIIDNYQTLSLNDGELMYLKNLKKGAMESFPDYFNYITGACLEQDNTFDGQDIDVLKNNLGYSASTQDVFDIANKYGVPLPQRLKKDEFLAFIFDYLKRKGNYTEALVNELNEMNITQLATYANRTGINMQPNMGKPELITYLFYFLDQCEIPSTSVTSINASEKYTPLEFRVDLQAVDSFAQGAPKKVIYYAGDHEDESQMNSILESGTKKDEVPSVSSDDILNSSVYADEPKTSSAIAEAVTPEASAPEAPAADPVAEAQAANPWKFIQKNFEDQKKAEEKAAQEAKAAEEEAARIAKENEEKKAMEAQMAEDIINITLAQIPDKAVEEEAEPKIEIDVKKTEQNTDAYSGRISSLANPGHGALWIGLAAGLSVAIVAFALVFMVFLK